TDTNRVTVAPIGILCRLLVSTNNGATFSTYSSPNCAVQIAEQSYIVRLIVTNTGQFPLTNVTITDVVGTFASCFSSPRNIGGLDVNGSTTIDCTNRCNACGTVNYAVSVVGEASQNFGHVCAFNLLGSNIVARSSCDTCVTCTSHPKIVVIKHCPASQVPPGGLAVFSGIVSNAGNVTLTNVIVVNDRPTNNTPVFGPITLGPGQWTNFTGSEVVPPNCCS